MHRLDHPEFPETALERVCKLATSILEQPYGVFIRVTHFPGGWLTLAPGLLSSLLWGAAFTFVYLLITHRKRHVT